MSASNVPQVNDVKHGEQPVAEAYDADLCDKVKKDTHAVSISVRRPIYSQDAFNTRYNHNTPDNKTIRRRVKDVAQRSCQSTRRCNNKKTWMSLLPFIGIMKDYSVRNDLLNDIVSGLTVGVMNVPQGMAYGILTTLDPVYGLYVSFFPVICYFFLGTSKHISVGTFAVISLMVGSAVEKFNCHELVARGGVTASTADYNLTDDFLDSADNLTSAGDIDDETHRAQLQCRLGVVIALTFLVGFYQVMMGLLKLGFVTIYMSDPLTRALTMAAAVHVFTSQVKPVFGINIGNFNGPLKLIYFYTEFFRNIASTNIASLITALVCIVIIYSSQRWLNPLVKKRLRMPIPAELVVIIFGTLLSHLASFNSRFNVRVVGFIPTGFPPPSLPPLNRFVDVAGDAVGIAIVAFSITISMSKLFAKKHSYRLEPNQELLAYGITNMTCSFLNCYVSCASLSRSLVQEGAGGKTQVAGLVSCSLLLVVLLAIGPLFRALPQCVLAAIVIVNLKGVLMQVTDIPTLYKKGQYFDLATWLVTALAVVLTDVDLGLFIGIGFSLLTIVFRTQRPRTSVLGRIPQTDLYEDIEAYPLAREIPGIKIFSFTSSLYYANAEFFAQRLYKKSGCNPELVKLQRAKLQRRREQTEHKQTVNKQTEMPLDGKPLNNNDNKEAQTFLDVEPAVVNNKRPAAARDVNTASLNPDEVTVDLTFIDGSAKQQDDKVLSTMNVDDEEDLTDAEDDDIEDSQQDVKLDVDYIILDCTSMMFIDTVGISALQLVIQDYKDIGVRVLLACCRESVFDQLSKAGVFRKCNQSMAYLAVHDAVLAAVTSKDELYQQLKCDIKSPLGSVLNVSYTDREALKCYKTNGTVLGRSVSATDEKKAIGV